MYVWIISYCPRNIGLENIFRIYAHGVPGKRPERPLEVLRESGDCSNHNWVEVKTGDGGNFRTKLPGS
jgi:hypothetical protein